ncbi:hypothetical protein G9464_06665 [Halostella sp. JP-L12]|uniref:DUF7115 domain-containing protein n=1 Tax=Halostella TaxID=1843185 RepID=UPI000EF8022D|nr:MULTISPECIES: hypothetical protein [Halostella]NHN47279.1 hypothetical protein [Halostella sp. JP-L12]
MDVPGIVESSLGDENVAARVSIGGEDELFVTPTRTLIYRADGLLSDETVEEYPHDAERLTVSEGRRKTKITLDYAIDGEREFTLPSKQADTALHPVLAGVLNASGVTEPGESVNQTYRFSELTIVITSDRLVKHVGEAVWDEEYEEYRFADVTGLDFEEGSVATQIVLEVNGRPQRIKAPNEQIGELRQRLTQALCSYYDVASEAELADALRGDEPEEDAEEDAEMGFGEGVDPLDADPPSTEEAEAAADDSDAAADDPEDAAEGARVGTVESGGEEGDDSEDGFDEAGFEPATSSDAGASDDVADELAELREVVEEQNELLEQQRQTIEQLIDELSRGR